MTLKFKAILIEILLILLGSFWLFYHGYKENGFIIYTSYILILIGWFGLLASIFGDILLKKRIKFKNHKIAWLKNSLKELLIYSLFALCFVANFVLIEKLADNRINRILLNDPTELTVATVLKIEYRYSRGGQKPWAVIRYSTEDKVILQAVFNYNLTYKVGQKYFIKYSVEYPSMFSILQKME